MPLWLLELLLANKAPLVQVVKVSFVLLPYPAKGLGEAALPELLNVYVLLGFRCLLPSC